MSGLRRITMGLAPALVLVTASVGRTALRPGAAAALRVPLADFPAQLADLSVTRQSVLSDEVLRVLRPDDYLYRDYGQADGREASLFVAYYGEQTGGSTIHSPRNCLPGSGWEPLVHERVRLPTVAGGGSVNRYIVEHDSGAKALVYYWYQGRGRVEANEYVVKWDLLRDAVFERRTEEALVRLVFPISGRDTSDPPNALAVVADVVRVLDRHLPS